MPINGRRANYILKFQIEKEIEKKIINKLKQDQIKKTTTDSKINNHKTTELWKCIIQRKRIERFKNEKISCIGFIKNCT